MPAHPYQLELANALLPLLRAIVEDLAAGDLRSTEARERFDELRVRRDAAQEELNAAHRIIREVQADRGEFLAELADLRIELEDAAEGRCAIPGELHDRPVVFSWKLGEPTIEFYREVDAPSHERHPLPVPAHA